MLRRSPDDGGSRRDSEEKASREGTQRKRVDFWSSSGDADPSAKLLLGASRSVSLSGPSKGISKSYPLRLRSADPRALSLRPFAYLCVRPGFSEGAGRQGFAA